MIIGIGNDIVDIRRIEKTIARYGDRFINRIYTRNEQAVSLRRATKTESYAKRFAAKEACAKALGTGFAKGVFWNDLGVENDEHGRPVMVLTGGAKARLNSMVPEGYEPVIHLSMSDEPPYAQAMVVISYISTSS